MDNMLIDEKTINKNIQYALSVIAENENRPIKYENLPILTATSKTDK